MSDMLLQQAEDEMSSIDEVAIPPLPTPILLALVGLMALGIRSVADQPGLEIGDSVLIGRGFLADIRDAFTGFPALVALIDDSIEMAS